MIPCHTFRMELKEISSKTSTPIACLQSGLSRLSQMDEESNSSSTATSRKSQKRKRRNENDN